MEEAAKGRMEERSEEKRKREGKTPFGAGNIVYQCESGLNPLLETASECHKESSSSSLRSICWEKTDGRRWKYVAEVERYKRRWIHFSLSISKPLKPVTEEKGSGKKCKARVREVTKWRKIWCEWCMIKSNGTAKSYGR